MKNRTYRYLKTEALYPFGYGLGYTEFTCTQETVERDGDKFTVSALLSNVGEMDGAETLQVYVKAYQDGAPNWQLKALKKVAVKAGGEAKITVALEEADFALYNEEGRKILRAGDYEVYVGTSQPDTRSMALTGRTPAKITVHFDEEKEIAE